MNFSKFIQKHILESHIYTRRYVYRTWLRTDLGFRCLAVREELELDLVRWEKEIHGSQNGVVGRRKESIDKSALYRPPLTRWRGIADMVSSTVAVYGSCLCDWILTVHPWNKKGNRVPFCFYFAPFPISASLLRIYPMYYSSSINSCYARDGFKSLWHNQNKDLEGTISG